MVNTADSGGGGRGPELPVPPPTDFDLADHLARSLGIYERPGPPTTIRLRFAPEVTRYVEESHWHPTQCLTRTPDGHLLAEFEVTALAEVQSWVLSFGAKCEVLGPVELREEIAAELAKGLDLYTGRRQDGRPKRSPSDFAEE